MSEMLANQLFMARKYYEAESEFESCLITKPDDKRMKRKLILCYTQTGKVQNALVLFEELIRQEIEFITSADPIADDCPCEELVSQYESVSDEKSNSTDYNIMLGIIWLYCKPAKSLEYFKFARKNSTENALLDSCIDRIEEYLKSQHSNQNHQNIRS